MNQEPVGGRATPLRIGGREMIADVALADGAEDGVGEGVQAGVGDLVYLVGSREAALACDPWFVPVDAAIVGIVDGVDAPKAGA